MGAAIGLALQSAFFYFVGKGFDSHAWLLSVLVDMLPTEWQAPTVELLHWLAVSDHWLATGFLCQCVLIYIQVWAHFVAIKMTLKLTPFIG